MQPAHIKPPLVNTEGTYQHLDALSTYLVTMEGKTGTYEMCS